MPVDESSPTNLRWNQDIFGGVPKGNGRPAASMPIDARWESIEKELPNAQQSLPRSGGGLLHLPAATAPLLEVMAALARDGAVILDDAVPEGTCDRVVAEMTPYLEQVGGGDGFLGKETQRAGALVARSPGSWDLIRQPTVLRLCEGVLGRQLLPGLQRGQGLGKQELASWLSGGNKQFPFQMHSCQLICIGPGNPDQPLHRDAGGMVFNFREKGIECMLSTMWALTEFTEENGATRTVPGSHLWPNDQEARTPEEVALSVMKKGSCLVYLGDTIHSGGGNRSAEKRWGLSISYNLAALRQEENQFLACPPEVAKKIPEDLQKLIGYTMPAIGLGYVDGFRHPKLHLDTRGYPGDQSGTQPINWASLHLPEFQEKKDSKL